MKRVLVVLFILLNISGCVSMAVKTSNLTEITTGTIRSIEQVKKDEQLTKAIKKYLKQEVKIFAEINNMKKVGNYKITSMEGRVLITGIVADIKMKNFIYNKIWEFRDVKEVINELEVSFENNKFIDNFFISRSIKNRLIITDGVRSVNYEVIVVNGKAYVFGIAYSEEEMRKVGYITTTTKGVKEAVLNVIVKNDNRRTIID